MDEVLLLFQTLECLNTRFTSIINQPNGAILSVGAIVKKPIIKMKE